MPLPPSRRWGPRGSTGVSLPFRGRELALATAGMAAGTFLVIGISALVPLIRHDMPLSGPVIGALATMPWVVAALSGLPAAAFVDRVGAGFAVGVSQALIAAGAVIVSLAPDTPVLFAGAAVSGAGFGILNPASSVLSTGTVAPRRRALAMSINQAGVTAGGAVAGLMLPGIAALTNWRTAMLVTALLLSAVAWWGLTTPVSVGRRPLQLSGGTVDVPLSRLAAYGFAMSGVQVMIFAYAAVYLVDAVELSPQAAGLGLAVLLTAGTIGRLVSGILSDRSGDRMRLLRAVAVGSALILAAVPFAPAIAIWAVLALVGLFSIGWNGVFLALVAEAAGERGVSRASSHVLTYMYAGQISLPPMLGFLIDDARGASWAPLWLTSAGIAVLAALVLRAPPGSGRDSEGELT